MDKHPSGQPPVLLYANQLIQEPVEGRGERKRMHPKTPRLFSSSSSRNQEVFDTSCFSSRFAFFGSCFCKKKNLVLGVNESWHGVVWKLCFLGNPLTGLDVVKLRSEVLLLISDEAIGHCNESFGDSGPIGEQIPSKMRHYILLSVPIVTCKATKPIDLFQILILLTVGEFFFFWYWVSPWVWENWMYASCTPLKSSRVKENKTWHPLSLPKMYPRWLTGFVRFCHVLVVVTSILLPN